MPYYVYFITNSLNTVLYTGMTNDLARRLFEHESGEVEGFSKKYNLYKLVYYEAYDNAELAILREKQIKNWARQKKNDLVLIRNPAWINLKSEINN